MECLACHHRSHAIYTKLFAGGEGTGDRDTYVASCNGPAPPLGTPGSNQKGIPNGLTSYMRKSHLGLQVPGKVRTRGLCKGYLNADVAALFQERFLRHYSTKHAHASQTRVKPTNDHPGLSPNLLHLIDVPKGGPVWVHDARKPPPFLLL